jgi:hypothetical protein
VRGVPAAAQPRAISLVSTPCAAWIHSTTDRSPRPTRSSFEQSGRQVIPDGNRGAIHGSTSRRHTSSVGVWAGSAENAERTGPKTSLVHGGAATARRKASVARAAVSSGRHSRTSSVAAIRSRARLEVSPGHASVAMQPRSHAAYLQIGQEPRPYQRRGTSVASNPSTGPPSRNGGKPRLTSSPPREEQFGAVGQNATARSTPFRRSISAEMAACRRQGLNVCLAMNGTAARRPRRRTHRCHDDWRPAADHLRGRYEQIVPL